jgi:hypothetical protein
MAKGGKHHDHDYDELHQVFDKIASSLEPMENQVTTITKALTQLDAHHGEISDQQAATADNIHVAFSRLRDILNVRETELIGQLDKITESKLKHLATQKDQLKTTLARLNSCLHHMRESLRTEDVLMMKSDTMQQMKELTIPFRQDTLKPNTEADLKFSIMENMTNIFYDCGEILLSGEGQGHSIRIVELRRPPNKFGMALLGGKSNNSPIHISSIVPEGYVDKLGTIRVGDQILSVNGKDLEGADWKEATELLRGQDIDTSIRLALKYSPILALTQNK